MSGRTVDDYGEKDLHTHIYDVPDTYVGSTNLEIKEEIIFDFETKKMRKVKLDLPDAVKRIVMEIISNAGDNSYFSRISKVNPGKLSLSRDDKGYLTVRNGGLPIPVEPHKNSTPEELYLLPTNIFSVLLTSSNYDKDKDRTGCGRNGYGSKLTNIFSEHFIVKVGDSGRIVNKKKVSGQEYYGEWKENMWELVKVEAKPGFEFKDDKWTRITKGEYTGEPYVEVKWKTDFNRMHMKRDYFTDDEFGLFARYMLEFSLTCGVPVNINGVTYDFRSIRDFARLYYDDDFVDRAIVGYDDKKFPEEFIKLKNAKSQEKYIAEKFIPETQFILLDTPRESVIHSYVNGLMTPDGGVHLDKLINKVTRPVVMAFNDKHKGSKIKKDDIIPHISIFLVNRLKNTEYESQSKKRLTKPTPNIDIDPKISQVMLSKEWNLMSYLENTILSKSLKDMSKTDGKKIAHLNLNKEFDDANEAGKAKSHECTLYIVEGHSAAGYPRRRISRMPGGKDFNGVYPLQGKVMNVKTHSMDKISTYKEFENIKKIIGLRQGMDYSLDKNFKTLRYGKIMINVDADSDGMHIMGLIFNLFREFWKELYNRNFVQLLVTPVVRATAGKKIYRFYDERSFSKWIENNRDLKAKIKYYKGLGSSKQEDIRDDVDTAPTLIIDLDKKGEELIERAFDGTRSNDRKDWIAEWRDERDSIEPFEPKKLVEHFGVSELMGKSFPPYMTDSIIRAIPSKYDGLKRSQRQVLYYALHHFKYGSSKKMEKVIAFSPNVVPYSKYHHGEKSLNDTVMKMTRDYCNGNNLPFFYGEGEFGTRGALGKDAAQPRYPELGAQWWTSLMYDQDLVELVDKKMVDGESAEPYWIVQTIPLGLVNGNKGMATGYSSFIPMHHPCDIANWLISRLDGKKKIEPIVPYYNGFIGEIHIYYKKNKEESKEETKLVSSDSTSNVESELELDDDDENIDIDFKQGRGFDIYGKFEVFEHSKGNKIISDRYDVLITEIPFTISLKKYVKFVKDLIDKKIAEDMRDTSDEDKGTVNIEIKGLKSSYATYEKLSLKSGLSLTNMYLIDNDGIPRKYGSIESILSEYVHHMLSIYSKYKELIIGKHEDELKKMNMELAIIESYLNGKLIIHKKSDDEVDEQLEKLKLDKKTFEKINLRGLTKTRVDILKNKIEELKVELKAFREKSEESLWKDKLVSIRDSIDKKKIFKTTYTIEDSKKVYIDGELSYKNAKIKYE